VNLGVLFAFLVDHEEFKVVSSMEYVVAVDESFIFGFLQLPFC
jgi:hypothetical protein